MFTIHSMTKCKPADFRSDVYVFTFTYLYISFTHILVIKYVKHVLMFRA